ncbi:MAG: sigma-70 family RNA polymerase sigma factor, partial [bacterium]|nr:sigma-70 family RNA polymerase sigma factor [bacterium]
QSSLPRLLPLRAVYSREDQRLRKSGDKPIDTRSDLDLWDDILKGDDKAWLALVNRYANLVYNVCTHIGLTRADSADCFQQTWLILFRNRKKITDAARISSWLITTAKREALRLLRKADRVSGDGEQAGLINPDPLPDAVLLQLESRKRLQLALSELDPACRQLLEAFFFSEDKQSYQEISRKLGYSQNTLGPKRNRCLKKLKKILDLDKHWDERKRASSDSAKYKKRRKN